jgi:acyl carrier protein
MTAREDTFAALCKLLEPFNAKGIALEPDTDISTDLNIDSVSVMDFVMEVEDHFDIDIPLNVLSETRTMSDLVKVVDTRLGKN